MIRRARRTAAATMLAALCAALTACSGSGGGTPSSPSASSDTPVPQKVLASGTLPATKSSAYITPPTVRATPPKAGLRDFRTANFSIPTGWEPTGDYAPVNALESEYTAKYLVPSGSSADSTPAVIAVLVYTLPSAKTVTAKTNIPSRIAAYDKVDKATSSGLKKAPGTIDGLTAYAENDKSPPNYEYLAYWAFGVHHLLFFNCQQGKGTKQDDLITGCAAVLASLQLS